jgi:hypothetical protein
MSSRLNLETLAAQVASINDVNTRQDNDIKSLSEKVQAIKDKYNGMDSKIDKNKEEQENINAVIIKRYDDHLAEELKKFKDVDHRLDGMESRHNSLKHEVRNLASTRTRSPSPARYRPSRDRDHYDYASPSSSSRRPPPPYSSYNHDQSRTVMGSTNTLVCPSTNVSHANCKSCSESNARASTYCSGACKGKEREREYGSEGRKERRENEKGYGSGYDGGLGGLVFGQYEGGGSLFGCNKKKGMFLALGGGGGRRR